MKEEIKSVKSNHVWNLLDFVPGQKAVENKWVLKIKCKVDESIERYKTHLVAKLYTQQKGIDYKETFSPVVRFNFICLPLAIVAHLDLELHQMDIKTSFLFMLIISIFSLYVDDILLARNYKEFVKTVRNGPLLILK